MDNFPEFDYVCDQKLSDIQCSTTEVENHLKVLDIYKSPGPDNISPRVLRECASELAPFLCILLNKSFSTGQLPCSWKIANITPLHKKGSKHSRNNYRQISLTSIIVKVGEKIVKNRVFNFWLDQNIFNPNQYAYLSGKSTLTQLSCFDDWSKSRNKSKSTDVVFLDFSKAFDSVPHERLLFKLKRYGIDDSLLLWFRNFLTNRRQRVAIRGTYSSRATVKSGVPQGTILGPILFLIYVNDISTKITSQIKLYADDTKLYRDQR